MELTADLHFTADAEVVQNPGSVVDDEDFEAVRTNTGIFGESQLGAISWIVCFEAW